MKINELIRNIQSGDSNSVEELLIAMQPLLKKYASKIYFLEFDDAYQELSITLLESIKYIISDANLKILKYGLNILYSTFLGILGVILCGIILKSSIYSFLFLLFYCPLRLFIGGYHAKTNFFCITLFIFIFIVILNINCHLTFNIPSILFLLIYFLLIYFFAPVESTKKPFSKKNYLRMKKFSIVLFLIFCLILYLFYYFAQKYYNFIFLIYTINILAFLAGILQNYFQ